MEKMVQRLGDGQLICSDCWAKNFEATEPVYGWIAGECDFCLRSQAAATLGRKGGSVKSPAKTAANREKGKYGHLGGRPPVHNWMILYFDGEDWIESANSLTKEEASTGMAKMEKQDPGTLFKICRATDY